jgi:hypothetical protein
VRAMLGVAGEVNAGTGRVADVRRRATQAETRLRRLQQAIEPALARPSAYPAAFLPFSSSSVHSELGRETRKPTS